MTRNGRRARRDRGSSVVELALIAPVLAVLVFGALDCGRAYRLQVRLDAMASAGATHAQLAPNDVDCGGDDIESHAATEDPDLDADPTYTIAVFGEDGAGDLTVTVTGCGGTEVDSGERVRVETSATYTITTPLIGAIVGTTWNISGSTEVEAL